jgi:hypothetical protein
MNDVRMTRKLPALVGGIIAIAGGLIAGSRGRRSAGIVLILLGLAFVIYSSTIKEWCTLHERGWGGMRVWGDTEFGSSLGECLREKDWFEF